ncbi:MAG: hypothetical protein A4E36_00092 [Methanoregulaceae archaeon PtaB.Bin009]|jgi:CRISPR/Cas system-associated protein Cas10 (large subunit of type III CRISPR-Cas system)|nr:MAG: hypothetical protein A4E36_00092 [Methanoregulaceae archaeon PtaB.Bin009]OPY42372.1 MAG: hypothetical protein A4E41_00364 [Methanoregulaceae archaeon PtaU1.Bin066]
MTLNGLKTRVDRIENKTAPRVIKTWADFMRYAAGHFGDIEIPLSDELREVYEDLQNERKTPG